MLGVSFAACAAVLGAAGVSLALPIAALLAVAATVIEAFSTDGLDNLWVPLGVSALYVVLFLPAAPYAPVLLGMLLSGAVVMASLRLGLLTVSGGLGALVVGALAFAIGGWPLWLLLMWFFGSSNIASRIMAKRTGKAAKKAHETRTLKQVLANSVPFLACAVAYVATGDSRFLIVSAAALAASTADTWASEIGVFSRKPPINILTGARMQRGLSGGVSPLGLGATAIGSTTSAFLAMLLFHAFGYAVPTGPTLSSSSSHAVSWVRLSTACSGRSCRRSTAGLPKASKPSAGRGMGGRKVRRSSSRSCRAKAVRAMRSCRATLGSPTTRSTS